LGTIAYVNVEIGYAPFADAGGSTIGIELSGLGSPIASAAAAMPGRSGATNSPAAFWIDATSSLFWTA
jgi:hypothetical protein